jgi:hypothetical protein
MWIETKTLKFCHVQKLSQNRVAQPDEEQGFFFYQYTGINHRHYGLHDDLFIHHE